MLGRLKAAWKEEFERWQQRDLSARRYVYIWADGVYLQARMEVEKQCILVLIGATPEGRKELIGFQTGFRESAQSWTELLTDLKSRGLSIGTRTRDWRWCSWASGRRWNSSSVPPAINAVGCIR